MAREDHRRALQQKPLGRRRVLGLSVGLGAAATFAACSGTSHRSRSQAGPAAQSGQPRYGGQLRLTTKTELFSFDPGLKNTPVATFEGLTNDSLLGFKVGPDVKYDDVIVTPAIAERWETPDTQAYTFHLSKAVKFAPVPPVNGRELTAADIKWTFEYLASMGQFSSRPKSPISTLFEGLERIETPDPATVVMHFAHPYVPFLTWAASDWTPIIPHEIFEQDGSFSKRMAGNGPWQLDPENTKKGAQWVFKRNPTYFQPGRPYIDQVTYVILPDDPTADAAFESKQLDILDYSGITTDAVARIKKTSPDAIVSENLEPNGNLLHMNVSKPPLKDTRVRKALALCIDRDEFVAALAPGKGQWAMAQAYPSLFSQDEAHKLLGKPDPPQAKQLLSDAGFPNGLDLELIYPGLKYGQIHVTKLQLLQAQWKKGGINVTLKNVDPEIEDRRKRSFDYQLNLASHQISGDVDKTLFGMFHTGSPTNYSRISDPKLDKLVEAQRQEVDANKRRAIVRQAVQYINEVPWAMALIFLPSHQLWHPNVKGYYARIVADNHLPIVNSWLDKSG